MLATTRDADALYWVAPPTGAEDPIAAYTRLDAARAVVENEVDHTVSQSSVGAEKRTGAGEIDGLAAAERALDATDAAVLHLRCGMFFTNLLLDAQGLEDGVLRVTWPLDRPLAWVDPRDVAEAAAARLLARDWSGRQVQGVHGPEDLIYEQAAAIVAEATVGRCAQSGFPTTRCVRGYAVSALARSRSRGCWACRLGCARTSRPTGAQRPHDDAVEPGCLGLRAPASEDGPLSGP